MRVMPASHTSHGLLTRPCGIRALLPLFGGGATSPVFRHILCTCLRFTAFQASDTAAANRVLQPHDQATPPFCRTAQRVRFPDAPIYDSAFLADILPSYAESLL